MLPRPAAASAMRRATATSDAPSRGTTVGRNLRSHPKPRSFFVVPSPPKGGSKAKLHWGQLGFKSLSLELSALRFDSYSILSMVFGMGCSPFVFLALSKVAHTRKEGQRLWGEDPLNSKSLLYLLIICLIEFYRAHMLPKIRMRPVLTIES